MFGRTTSEESQQVLETCGFPSWLPFLEVYGPTTEKNKLEVAFNNAQNVS